MDIEQEIDSLLDMIDSIHQTQAKLEKITELLDEKASNLVLKLKELQATKHTINTEDK